ncbi:MAG: Ig-like domain-containing protein [bacterium]
MGGQGGAGGIGGEGGEGGQGGEGGAPIALDALTIDPARLDLIAGQTATLRVTGRYTDGTEADLTPDADWQSTLPAVAAIGQLVPEGRQIVALGDGNTQIIARVGDLASAPAPVAVIAVRPVELRVEPAVAQVAAGQTLDFRAFARFNDGNEAEVTARAEWRSTNPLVAEIANAPGVAGRATSYVQGSTRITALFEGLVSAPIELRVDAAALRALAVTPDNPTGSVGEELRLTATGTYTDGSTRDQSAAVEWQTSDPAVVTIDAAGRAALLAVGAARVTARQGEIVAPPQTITVRDARVVGLTVAGDPAPIVVGTQRPLRATAALSDGTDADYTGRAEWQSDAPAIARVDAAGRVTGIAPGQARITARFGDVSSAPFSVTVQAVAAVELTLDPDEITVSVGDIARLTARARYNDGTSADVTAQALWQSANPVVATAGQGPDAGVVRGLAPGETRVTARLGDLAAAATVYVEAAPLVALAIAPLEVELPIGGRQPFTAIARYADGTDRDVTAQAEWRTDAPAVLGADRNVFTALAVGEATVTATLDGIDSDEATVTVTAAIVEAIRIEPAVARIIIGESFPLAAIAVSSDGTERDVTEEAMWTAIDEGIATVSNRPGSRGRVDAVNIGETTVRATLGEILSAPAAIVVLPVPNRAPDVEITCPDGGREGEALDFSAQGSTDADGEIVRFIWTFGDAAPLDVGDAEDISYTFATSGRVDVELTAEDDAGARATARCTLQIQSANAPTVRFVRPQGVRETTQGAEIDVLVDARPGPGRDITTVALLLDGVEVATDETAPYEMRFTVPLAAATGASLRLVARAIDDTGDAGVSTAVILDVQNDLPVPHFVAVPTDLRRVTVDATGVTDDTTDTQDLEVRWDWENDGTYDTAFDVNKVASHVYPAEGEYTIRMQVRDNVGQTASATRVVRFTDRQVVSGDIQSQVWAGTILVTGDVRLLPGHTLTIVAGTSVQFARVDQDNNGYGDYDLTINGTLRVQGTPEEPVVFTVFGDADRAPNAWQGIVLAGDEPSEIRHAIIEFARSGIQIDDASVVEDVLIQQVGLYGINVSSGDDVRLARVTINDSGHTGVRLVNADRLAAEDIEINRPAGNGVNGRASSATFDRLTIRDAGETGLLWQEGTLTVNGAEVIDGACHGVNADDAITNLTGLRVAGNGCIGVLLRGNARGRLTLSDIIENRNAGVQVEYLLGRDPTVAVVRNNIHSNASGGARRFSFLTDVLTVSDVSSAGGAVSSANWSPPAGFTLHAAEVQFSVNAGLSGTGELLNADNGAVLTSLGSSGSRVVDVPGNRIRVRANLAVCCGTATMTVRRVYLSTDGGPAQLVVSRLSGTLDARENYLGRYPDVLPAVTFSTPGAVDIQGFVGVPYGDDFDTGPYYGGSTLTDAVEWSGVVYVSGDVTIGAAGRLTVAPGTEIRVAPIDQEANGIGDYHIRTDGPATIEGTPEAPIVFRTDGDGAPNTWDRLRIAGAGTLAHVRVEGARVGLHTNGAGITAHDIELTGNHVGLEVGGNGPVFDRLDAHDNASIGLQITGPATLRVVRSADNGGHGVTLGGGPATVEDLLVTGNAGNGLVFGSAAHTLGHVEITDNAGQGIDAEGNVGGALTACSITFNGGAGVHLRSDGASHPFLSVTGCNIFGNASQDGVGTFTYREESPNLTASDVSSAGGAVTSAVHQAAAQPFEAEVQFSVNAGLSGNGELLDADNNSVLVNLGSSSTRWTNITARRLRTRANLAVCCGTATMTLRRVRQYTAGVQQLEMSAGVWAAARVDARGNYWGVFPNVQAKIHEIQNGSIDYSGFLPDAVRNVGPRALP